MYKYKSYVDMGSMDMHGLGVMVLVKAMRVIGLMENPGFIQIGEMENQVILPMECMSTILLWLWIIV